MPSIALNTLTVRVLNARGQQMFDNTRFLRVVTAGPDAGKFAVARHGKALIVTDIKAPDAVSVDSTALRVDLNDTRAAKLTDIGMTPKVKATASVAIPSDMPALVTKYKAAIAKSGKVWIENALTHTKDIVKREAMEIALGRKPEAGAAPVKASKPRGPKTPSLTEAGFKKAAPAVDVNALARAIQEGGAEAGVAYLSGLVKVSE